MFILLVSGIYPISSPSLCSCTFAGAHTYTNPHTCKRTHNLPPLHHHHPGCLCPDLL